MGKTWKDKNKWEKKREDTGIKKTKKEHRYSSNDNYDTDKNFNRASSFEWYDYDYKNN